jgi:Rad3-related DNA helicase
MAAVPRRNAKVDSVQCTIDEEDDLEVVNAQLVCSHNIPHERNSSNGRLCFSEEHELEWCGQSLNSMHVYTDVAANAQFVTSF